MYSFLDRGVFTYYILALSKYISNMYQLFKIKDLSQEFLKNNKKIPNLSEYIFCYQKVSYMFKI